MRYGWNSVPALLRVPIGRMHLLHAAAHAAWPIYSRVAGLYRRTLARKTRVAAVVGSFGKSTTARCVVTALGGRIDKLSERNSRSFLARAVLRIRPKDRHAVIEVGISEVGQMAAYARIIRPDITVVTAIGSEHHRSLGTLEVTRTEKSEMVRILPETGVAVLNGDDSNIRWMKGLTRARVITYGLERTNDIHASDIKLDWPDGTRFTLNVDGKTYDMRVRLVGRMMVYPILAAVAVAWAEGFGPEEVLPALESVPPTTGRNQPVAIAGGAILLRDEYKSALETIEAALDVLSEIPSQRRIVVMGEISEPPGSQGPIYRHMGERIGMVASKAVFICGKKSFKSYAIGAERSGLPRHSLVWAGKSVLKVVEALQADLQSGDVVLLKGRDTQRLERIALALTGRTVRCDISLCMTKATRCEHCPMLERDWDGLRSAMFER